MATPTELYDQFLQIARAGDEEAAKKFLADHLNEFPEETRNEILFAFYEQAVLKQADEVATDVAMKQEGLEALTVLEKAQKDIDNEIRIEELKEGLGAK